MVRRSRAGKRVSITLDEWLAAVRATPNARPMQGDWGEGTPFSLPANPGDVEVQIGPRWQPVIRCSELSRGLRITTKPVALGDPAIRAVLAALAHTLSAVVEGDEGERYDLATGDPVARPR